MEPAIVINSTSLRRTLVLSALYSAFEKTPQKHSKHHLAEFSGKANSPAFLKPLILAKT